MAHLRPASEGFENSDRDYENVLPPRVLRLQQLGTKPAREAKPDVPSSITLTDNTRGRSWKTPIVILYLLVCVSLLIATTAFVLSFLKFFPRCPYGWQTFQAKCYHFSMNNVTWMEAKWACQSLGAHLVVIGDDEEGAAEQFSAQNNE
ncbi:uncharacterized protein LOC123035628 isoform X2 [Varanus komodoensis]|uniref:uncharacterized protein LOC123035628 isoform X2 n=1 Tax=Varanus komodoensis TaxID=61221 RepID=UPI001CF7E1B5|nr:uncharacterized protein LOC123035628 isoform X2 [Varanus komodoensis]